MTVQITVRLPDENVAWLDAEVAAGRFPSRTAGLAKLLKKAQRRQEDDADMLKILANPDPDEESRLEWMRTREYPDMGEVPGPAAGLVLDNVEIRGVDSVATAADNPQAAAPAARSLADATARSNT